MKRREGRDEEREEEEDTRVRGGRERKREIDRRGGLGLVVSWPGSIAELRGLIVLYCLGGPEGETRGFVRRIYP